MHAAANTKGGVGGVSQSVGREFSEADKPGKLPARKAPSQRLYGGGKVRGFAEGGKVTEVRSPDAQKQVVVHGSRKQASRAEIDVDEEAQAYRNSHTWSQGLNRAQDGKADPGDTMNTDALAPGTQDNIERANLSPAQGIKYAPGVQRARGGEIKEVAGKPIGKDDGIIAAQRGEFVVKKSAVKKLGSAVLNEINKGRLPSERLYGSRKAVRHA